MRPFSFLSNDLRDFNDLKDLKDLKDLRVLKDFKDIIPETLVMFFTRHTDLRNKTPLLAEVARRTACPRAAEGVRVCKQNMLNDLKRIGNSYQVPQGQRIRVVSSESQSDDTIIPLCFPNIR